MLPIADKPEGWLLKIVVQPRSSHNRIAGLHNDAVKIKLTAPPVDNAANKLCLEFLAKNLGIAKSRLSIVSGETGRTKQILVRADTGTDRRQQKKALVQRLQTLLKIAAEKKSP